MEQAFPLRRVDGECARDKLFVDEHSAQIDGKIEIPFIVQLFRHGESAKPIVDRHLRHYVLRIIRFEERPLF